MSDVPKLEHAAKILIVDDVPENLHLLLSTLTQGGYDVRNAINGELAMMGVMADKPDLILLDINMPGMDGFEVCQKLQNDALFADIPIIFISAISEAFDKVKAFEMGGSDYITKPFQLAEVLARVRHQLELSRLRKELSSQNHELRKSLKFKFFEPELKKRLDELELDSSFRDRVHSSLLELLPAGGSSIEIVADKLGISKRTLQRRLKDESTSFQDVLNQTREELARYYLQNSSLSGGEISHLLGFDDPNSFFRAFQIWTGTTPKSFRQENNPNLE